MLSKFMSLQVITSLPSFFVLLENHDFSVPYYPSILCIEISWNPWLPMDPVGNPPRDLPPLECHMGFWPWRRCKHLLTKIINIYIYNIYILMIYGWYMVNMWLTLTSIHIYIYMCVWCMCVRICMQCKEVSWNVLKWHKMWWNIWNVYKFNANVNVI
jgi:hypothetical protein